MSDRVRKRRQLYTGGALMVLAPIGVLSCSGSTSSEEKTPAPQQDAAVDQVAADSPQQDSPPEVVAIVPTETGFPEATAIAPIDASEDGPTLIAPADGPLMVAPAIAPADAPFADSATIDSPPDAPTDGPKEGGEGEVCQDDTDCLNTLFCEQMMCVIACDPSCQPLFCDSKNPDCPTGSSCEKVNNNYQCVRK